MQTIYINNGDKYITIDWSDANNGYCYNIYNSLKDLKNEDDQDGGLCTGTMADAVVMAMAQCAMLDLNEVPEPQEDED